VHVFRGSNKIFSSHWFTTRFAKYLVPIVVKHASLITSVSEGYYAPLMERNPSFKKDVMLCAMRYGGEESDLDFIPKGFNHKAKALVVLPR
jgi:hypothetical protein